MAPGAGGKGHLTGFAANQFGIDDFISLHIFQNAVLVDAGRMGEGVDTDNGFVHGYGDAHQAGNQAACFIDLLGIQIVMEVPVIIFADQHSHCNFFQGGIARSFADAVYIAFHLAGTVLDGGQRINTARPRSLWQWTLIVALSILGTRFAIFLIISYFRHGIQLSGRLATVARL